jgi:hypothetical protein
MPKLFLVFLVSLFSFSAFSQTAWEITWDFYGTRHQGLLLVDEDDTGLLRVKCWNIYNGVLLDIVDQDVVMERVYDGVAIYCYRPRTMYGNITYSADNFKIFNNGSMYMQDDNGNWSTAIVMYQIMTTFQLNSKMREYGLK